MAIVAPSALAADSSMAKVHSEEFTIYHDGYKGGWCTFTDSDDNLDDNYWTSNGFDNQAQSLKFL
ncbi:hypothetical protein ACH4SK_17435 [Streptomyces inhibens]|uniref:hypothetical protein n=1 Tax=Streptomyces inhibens TaxID=2293571 RepID=UPI00379AF584